MKRFLVSLVLGLAVLSMPALASLASNVTWIDEIPGLRQVDFQENNFKMEKTYTLENAEKNYNQVVRGLKEHGWRVVKTDLEDDNKDEAKMPDVTAVKDGMKLEIEVDSETNDGRTTSELQIKLKKRP